MSYNIIEQKKRRKMKMGWQFIVALVIAVPVILFPAAFVWYLNISGTYKVAKEILRKRAIRNKVKES